MRVKELLKERGITSKELAKHLNMSETGLSITLGDDGNPSLKKLKEIADFFNVEVSELFNQPSNTTITCPKCGTVLEITVKE